MPQGGCTRWRIVYGVTAITSASKRNDEAPRIAANIAKLPSVPRQILKDIPRPPNSASRDD
jgi:hypothetical protein